MFCAITGLILTMVGTLLVGVALVQDWRAHAGAEPLIPVVAKARRWFVHTVLHRPPGKHTVTSERSMHWHVAATPAVYESPPGNAPVDLQMRFVRDRIRALEETIASQRSELDRRIDEMRARRPTPRPARP